MSWDVWFLCLFVVVSLSLFLEKIGTARETEADARQTEAEARLLEAQNEAERLRPSEGRSGA